jgi:hypothetical protein
MASRARSKRAISLCACCALDSAARRRSTAALGAVIKFIASTAVGLAVLTLAYNQWLHSKYREAYGSVPLGAAEVEVTTIAGEPSWVTDGTRWVEPGSAKDASELVPGCVKELWYAMPWPQPLRYSFCFDTNGALVHKYNWVSW